MPKAMFSHPDAILFGAIIRQFRVNRGWTIRKCAQRLGISANYLGILEAGNNMLSIPLLLEVADVFNVEASTIVRTFEEARKIGRAAVEAERKA